MRSFKEYGEDGSDSEEASNGEEVRAIVLQEEIIPAFEKIEDFEEDDLIQDFEQKGTIQSDQAIVFQGAVFDFKVSRTTPIEAMDKDKSAMFGPLIDHLKF